MNFLNLFTKSNMNFLNLFTKNNKEVHTFNVIKGKRLEIINDIPEQFDDDSVDNDWGLGFEEKCNLTIYNNRKIENAKYLKDFVGEKVVDISYSNTIVEFKFSGNKKIIVSLKPEDWHGPEAMQLNYKNQIYIWN